MTKVTFHGLAAWVGAIQSPTISELWNRDPNQVGFDRGLLLTVDQAKTPSAAIAGQIRVDQIEVDDHVGNGGRTTIGPLWPSGTTIGACWVTELVLKRAGAITPPVLPDGGNGFEYEFMTVQYFDGEEANRRFHGFHANVLQVQNGLSLVQIWNPGTGARGAPPAGAWWLDLKASADPSAPPLQPCVPGPVFLDTATVRLITTFEPKLPPYRGGFALVA